MRTQHASEQVETILKEFARNPLFADCRPEHLLKILPYCRLLHFSAGRKIIREGRSPEAVYCLVSGGVCIYHSDLMGKDIVVKLFKAPAFFGEADVIVGSNWLQTVTTVLPSVVIEVRANAFKQLIDNDLGLARALVRDLSMRLLICTELVRKLSFGAPDAMLATYLLDLASLFGESTSGGTRIAVSLSQAAVAQALNLSRRVVNQTFNRWIEEDLLERNGKHYTLRDMDTLRTKTAFSPLGLAHQITDAPSSDLAKAS